MKFHWDKKYLHWGVTAFLVIIASISFFLFFFFFADLSRGFSILTSVLTPIIIGFAIAYLLSPIHNMMHRNFEPLAQKMLNSKKTPEKEVKARKFSQAISVVFTFISFFLVAGLLITLAVPQVVEAMKMMENPAVYVARVTQWIEQALGRFSFAPDLAAWFVEFSNGLQQWLNDNILPQINQLAQTVGSGLLSVIGAFKNLVLGFIISIYVLLSKDLFVAQSKRLVYAFLKPQRANALLDGTRKTHAIFGGFINGRLLDSFIVGVICFMVMTLFNWPFAALISVIIGISNIIPFFGPFIGAIPSSFFLLLYDARIGFYFIIFILILQQVDGNIIGPRILGDATGISGFWVLASLLVGGGLFGIMGMLLAVPVFAVFYTLCGEALVKRLKRKELPYESMDYRYLRSIEPDGTVTTFSKETPKANKTAKTKKRK